MKFLPQVADVALIKVEKIAEKYELLVESYCPPKFQPPAPVEKYILHPLITLKSLIRTLIWVENGRWHVKLPKNQALFYSSTGVTKNERKTREA